MDGFDRDPYLHGVIAFEICCFLCPTDSELAVSKSLTLPCCMKC